jgi:hypothetical protein
MMECLQDLAKWPRFKRLAWLLRRPGHIDFGERLMSTTAARAALLAGIFTVAGLGVGPAGAADLPIPIKHAGAARWCGSCGCLHVTYNYHRELRATYGINYDPRSYDTTEPHYFYGAVRAYPRYWVAADGM